MVIIVLLYFGLICSSSSASNGCRSTGPTAPFAVLLGVDDVHALREPNGNRVRLK
jgi:hypothetical protein